MKQNQSHMHRDRAPEPDALFIPGQHQSRGSRSAPRGQWCGWAWVVLAVTLIAAGRADVALAQTTHVAAWGNNSVGQTSVPDALSGVVQVAAGAYHTVALWKHENAAPTADAGGAQTIIAGQTVQLDGAASSDPDDDPLTYDWSLNAPGGSTASLDDDSAITPSFCADEAGNYTATLTVNDGFTDSQADEATITALNADEALNALATDLEAFGPDGDGTLNMGQVGALTRKLEQAQKLLDKGKTDEALLVLADYQLQLNDFEKEGVLNPAQLQALDEPASAITAVLEAPCTGTAVAAKYASASETATLSSRSEAPTDYALGNYPNPFNPQTTISFDLPEASAVRLVVYDLLGREVARLVEGSLTAGRHTARFDARALPSGTYVYRLEAGSFSQTRMMLLVK